MNFTVFLNTRGRINQFKHCLEILEHNTKDKSKVEFIVRGDDDDTETTEFFSTLKNRNTFDFRPIVGGRPVSLCGSFNEMAGLGRGKYLFVLTDDAEVLTPNWDEIALDRINEFKLRRKVKDGIIYGCTSDTSVDKVKGESYASFPIISKEAFNVIGMFMYDTFVGLGGDSSIYRVYKGINRVVDLSEIQIDHIYNNSIFKVMSPDLTGHEMRQRTAQAGSVDPFTFDVSNEIAKLTAAIEGKK